MNQPEFREGGCNNERKFHKAHRWRQRLLLDLFREMWRTLVLFRERQGLVSIQVINLGRLIGYKHNVDGEITLLVHLLCRQNWEPLFYPYLDRTINNYILTLFVKSG